MKKFFWVLFLFPLISAYADEGMWMPCCLNSRTQELMKELGLEIPVNRIYNTNQPSLKDAVVSFGGFCSGVVVSSDGLVFTNHHCGFNAIQQHSSVEHDYLKDGFVAKNREEELPNPDLFISFLIKTDDVTNRILEFVTPDMKEDERQVVVDSMIQVIQNEVIVSDSLLRGVVDSYYGGNEYYLSVYKDYNDIRLVFAPPSSVGKFGGDTDNWVWPRHTGDFSVFRIYADKENSPAFYSKENVPYSPDYVADISLDGYQEGSFCMTMGYPGRTERYFSSFGIKERVMADNTAMIEVRGVKQAIWKDAMLRHDSIRIKYASKYATSANYWKNSIGMNKAIEKLDVIEKKQSLEQELKKWIQQKPDERNKYVHVLTDLELAYRNRLSAAKAAAFFGETFAYGPDVLNLTLSVLNFDMAEDNPNLEAQIREMHDKYRDFDLSVDKDVFVNLLKVYHDKIDSIYLPPMYSVIKEEYGNDYRKYVDYLYSHSQLTTPYAFEQVLKNDSAFNLFDDPIAMLGLDLLVKFYDINQSVQAASLTIEKGERLLNAAVREMREDKNFYPDANSTMRLSIGMVGGYSPSNAVKFSYFTTTKGIFEKVSRYKGDHDFEVQPALLSLMERKDFGKYATPSGDMNVCFISDNDITGGNSGSGMFNAKGELIGLAFDGNWEAMSGDIIFEPKLQRCIGVDIRYVLYMIDKYGKALNLIEELKLN